MSVNYIQAGPTIACGHCVPDRFAVSPLPCPCLCHEASAALDKLTDEARLGVMLRYCRSCGSTDPKCQCWNDE